MKNSKLILSVTESSVNVLNTTIKVRGWQIDLKAWFHLYAFYKGHALDSKSNRLKVKE